MSLVEKDGSYDLIFTNSNFGHKDPKHIYPINDFSTLQDCATLDFPPIRYNQTYILDFVNQTPLYDEYAHIEYFYLNFHIVTPKRSSLSMIHYLYQEFIAYGMFSMN